MGYKSKISDSHEPDISILTKTLTNIRERYCSTVSYIVLQIYGSFPDYQTYLRCSITLYLLVRLVVYVEYNLNGLPWPVHAGGSSDV